jgi:predicted permease
MDQLRTLLSRIATLFGRQRLNADLEEELRTHIDMATAENMTLGMSRRQARTKALREFGGLAQTRETYRTRRGFPLLDEIGRDLRFGLRQLYRAPGFALTAILTLALGLGANTAVFSLVNALLLRPLAVPHSEQLVIVRMDRSDSDFPNYGFNAPLFRTLEKHHEVFEYLAASFYSSLQVRGTSGNQQIPGLLVSGQFFQVLETPPLMGRYLTPADDKKKGSSAGFGAVINESFWHTWFNSAPDVVGCKLMIANTPFTVVGVMPREFIGSDPTRRPKIFVPLSAEPIVDAPYDMIEAGFHANWLDLIGRRQPSVSLEQANAALQVASLLIYEDSNADADRLKDARTNHVHFTVESGSKGYTYFREFFRKPLFVVFCLCGAMLLLACFNLASLLMARAAARERELATRLAIGATKGRLIQQLLVETFLIAALGTAAGLAVSPVISRGLAALLLSKDRDTVLNTSLDLRVFAFAAVLAAIASLLIGLMPALRATSRDLNDHLKGGSQARSPRDRRRLLPRVLMGSEVGLALLLVVCAGLLASSVTRLYRTGLGFNPKGIVDLQLNMDKQSLNGNALLHWYQRFAEALGSLPGVENVSYESQTPLSGSTWTNTLKTSVSNGDQLIYMNAVAPDYFATMRIPMLTGQDFRWRDGEASEKKIILNQSAAKILFPNQNPVGQFVSDYGNQQSEVIAVVGNIKYRSIRAEAPPGAYEAITLGPDKKRSYTVVVRIKGSPAPLGESARMLAARMAPDIPAPVMTSLSKTLDASISSERMMAMLAVFFAACALLVTAIGLYGTLAYSTARRTSEIGIRIALGAQRTQVVLLVFRENAWVAACGSLAGLAAALLASRALSSFLYGTSVRDPWVLVGSVATLISIASAASLLPAIRAARIEPMEALRAE